MKNELKHLSQHKSKKKHHKSKKTAVKSKKAARLPEKEEGEFMDKVISRADARLGNFSATPTPVSCPNLS